MSNFAVVLLLCLTSLSPTEADEAAADEVECNTLSAAELKKKILEGLCEPIKVTRRVSTTTTELPLRHRISPNTKRRILKTIYFGNQRFLNVTLNTETAERSEVFEVVDGTFLELRCDVNTTINDNNDTNVTIPLPKWYVDGEDLVTFLSWRTNLYDNNTRLLITPVNLALDGGMYECVYDGKMAGWLMVDVKGMWESLLDGVINYFVVIGFGLPIFIMITACQALTGAGNSVQSDPLFLGADVDEEEEYEEMMMNMKDAELRN